jgi:hypothetical protein
VNRIDEIKQKIETWRRLGIGAGLSHEETDYLFAKLDQANGYLDRIGGIKKDKPSDEAIQEVTTILADRYRDLLKE